MLTLLLTLALFQDGRSPEHPVLWSAQPSVCARQEMLGISVCPARLRLWPGAVFETDRNCKVCSSQSHSVLLTVLVPALGCRTPIRGAASWGKQRTWPSSTDYQDAEMAGQALPLGGQDREEGEGSKWTAQSGGRDPFPERGRFSWAATRGTSEGAVSQGCPATGRVQSSSQEKGGQVKRGAVGATSPPWQYKVGFSPDFPA